MRDHRVGSALIAEVNVRAATVLYPVDRGLLELEGTGLASRKRVEAATKFVEVDGSIPSWLHKSTA
jgi:hypothetical protein